MYWSYVCSICVPIWIAVHRVDIDRLERGKYMDLVGGRGGCWAPSPAALADQGQQAFVFQMLDSCVWCAIEWACVGLRVVGITIRGLMYIQGGWALFGGSKTDLGWLYWPWPPSHGARVPINGNPDEAMAAQCFRITPDWFG